MIKKEKRNSMSTRKDTINGKKLYSVPSVTTPQRPYRDLTLIILVSSADIFCNMFGPRSGQIQRWV